MKISLFITWIALTLSSVYAEEDSTSPPYTYSSGSRLYPTLTGVTDYSNKNNYNNIPGQTNNYNSGSRYPYAQPGNNQPYPVGTGPYNMSYSGYPGSNLNSYNPSLPSYPSTGYRPGTNPQQPPKPIVNPHQPFGPPKPVTNPHQPFGTSNNPYQNQVNNTRPYNTMNTGYPGYPTNQGSASYPSNPTYPGSTNHGTGNSYPYNPNYRGNNTLPKFPLGSVDPGFGYNPGSTVYRTNGTSFPRQPSANNDPHRPFGQPPKAGSSNNYYRH